MPAKRILMLCGDFGEDYETMVPFQALQAVGHTVQRRVSGQGGRRKNRHRDSRFRGRPDLQREARSLFHVERGFLRNASRRLRRIADTGRPRSRVLRLNLSVLECVRHFAKAGKPLAAICTVRQILAAARRDRGSARVAYPACRPEVELAGANYADIAIDAAVTDGNLVTAPAWPAHPAWIAQFLQLLGTRIIL